MIELWGVESCIACKQATMLLEKANFKFKYVSVENTGFEGELPRLVFDDGTNIVGLGPIHRFIIQQR